MVQKVAVKCEFEARLCHATARKLSVNPAVFELGKNKAAKGEGWAPPFISCAQDTLGLTTTAPMAIRLWKTFTNLKLRELFCTK